MIILIGQVWDKLELCEWAPFAHFPDSHFGRNIYFIVSVKVLKDTGLYNYDIFADEMTNQSAGDFIF
jgi:hypothetical protein